MKTPGKVPVPTNLSARDQAIVDRVVAADQGQCFTWWNVLTDAERRHLLDQLNSFDYSLLAHLVADHLRAEPAGGHNLGPCEVIRLPATPQEKSHDAAAYDAGVAALAAGEVGICLVAGGQGTRLGYDGPKGTFPISPVEGKTLFQWHAEKILALVRRHGLPIPWYIMTSTTNDEETRAFFAEHAYFGVAPTDVMFFTQGMLPALDMDGKLILDGRDHVHESPNGHGGSLQALRESGALQDMRSRGVRDLFYFQVDNPLTPMADPRFLGYHRTQRAEMSAKVVAKRVWNEKVGVFGTINGRLGVIEYSDLSEAEARKTDAQGRLVYWAGNEAVHAFTVDFVERLTTAGHHLPYHRAIKAVPCLDAEGRLHTPVEKNGNKFEMFVFDALGEAERTALVEVVRERDFAPTKNAEGEDSPAMVRQMLSNEFGRWLEACGVPVPRTASGDVEGQLEISPLTADGPAVLAAALPAGITFRDGLSL